MPRDFWPSVFFSWNNPPRTMIHGLKPFRIWPCIQRKNRFENCRNCIPAVSSEFPFNIKFSSNYLYVMLTYFCSFCYGVLSKGMRANNRFCAESLGVKIFALAWRPRDRIPQSRWHRGIWFSVSHWNHTVKGSRGEVSFDSQKDKYASQLSCDASSEAYL
jgi:hypothetical protein